MYHPFVISGLILGESEQQGQKVTPLKLVKLAYLCHGFCLGYLGRPMLEDAIEAWKYGPVIRRLYNAINHFGREKINHDFFDWFFGADLIGDIKLDDAQKMAKKMEKIDEDAGKVLRAVMATYGKYDGLQLSAITHRPDTPWDVIQKRHGIFSVIPNSLIREHYKKIIHDNPQ